MRKAQKQNLEATRKERSQVLDHMEHVTGLKRKTLIRHMIAASPRSDIIL